MSDESKIYIIQTERSHAYAVYVHATSFSLVLHSDTLEQMRLIAKRMGRKRFRHEELIA